MVILQERNKKAQNISDMWQANNLTFEGLQKVLHSLESNSVIDEQKSPLPKEIQNDWNKLALFMSKHRG